METDDDVSYNYDGIGVRLFGAVLAVAIWSVAMWLAWFAWDRHSDVIGGVHYTLTRMKPPLWQCVGCGFAIAVAVVRVYLFVRRRGDSFYHSLAAVLLAGAASAAFAATWTWNAAKDPTDDGIFFVTIAILIAGPIGLLVLISIANDWARDHE